MPNVIPAFASESDRYRANQPLKPIGVVLHSVGTPQPDATVFVNIWQENRSPYFTHYVLDDSRIYQTMPDSRKCWHVGSPGNDRYLGIEMCEPAQIRYTSGASFTVTDEEAARTYATACYQNAVWLLAKLCRTYGWNPQTAILTHGEVTAKNLSNTDHVDPEHLWSGLSLPYSLATLRDDVAMALGEIAEEVPETPVNKGEIRMDPARSYEKAVSGRYRVTADFLNVRAGAGTAKDILAALPQDTQVLCYGYYTLHANGTRWLYVVAPTASGFCSERYLERL